MRTGHGNPFPGHEDVTSTWLPLSAIPAGERITIRRLHEFAEDNPEMLQFLIGHGILPGAEIRVQANLPFNQTLTISIAGNDVTLGFPAARYIFAERK